MNLITSLNNTPGQSETYIPIISANKIYENRFIYTIKAIFEYYKTKTLIFSLELDEVSLKSEYN